MEKNKDENKKEDIILKDPKNYAAIYARISSKKDNNSIDAQISGAKAVLNEKNLFLYAVYTDHISGYHTPPPDRPGFGKLLEDAKSGCFKTLIAFQHDRIVRNLNDWVNLKKQLKKLGIKIIYSDENEYNSEGSLQGDFLENLIVMVGELEPNNILERTNYGRLQRRNEGMYNSARNIPFGYDRKDIPIDIETKSKSNSRYAIMPLKAIFIQHLFYEAREVLGENKEKIKLEDIKRIILSKIKYLRSVPNDKYLSELLSYANTTKEKLIENHEKESFFNKIIKILEEHLEEETLFIIDKELSEIAIHLDSTSNITTILKSPIYGGYMLKDSKEKEKGIIIEGNTARLKEGDTFIKLKNVAPIIDKNTFAKVYCYMHLPSLLKVEKPDFLFKGKLKCGNCNVLLNITDGLLQCTHVDKKHPKCKAYAKNSVIESILDIIIDCAFDKSKNGFNNFCNSIKGKTDELRKDLQKLRDKKMFELKNYLLSKDKDKSCIKVIQDRQNEINLLLYKISAFANELSYIDRLQQIIKLYNNSEPEIKKTNAHILKIKSIIINHIISNEDIFKPVLNKLIKEIKVITIDHKKDIKCRFTVNYEFNYEGPTKADKSSYIPTCIY